MNTKKSIHSPVYSELIDRLAEERKRLGLSQLEVATALNLTQADISKVEHKERRLDVLELKKMLEVYRISENKKLRETIIKFFVMDKK
ncbi:TPA: helix-turn-helix domain-containing protein [Enterobacter hormaechei]|nr:MULTISPECIES: helix-turn-helix transcriptional regulator [Enterobacteriaceae]EHQ6023005.1 helix-turn-helix transcriptional regulator [Salmonella enterica]MCN8332443.1 helix-turn-helix transcriptional regulator [Escherichia coli]HCD1320044.1 helix-turn-helix transcriptional regulator [Klebsiella variicola subsp. variicola]HCK0931616.1 helix-turn-helix transcriptional regulator [Klebsiella oxytoca]ELB7803785.1 helix-turn-helix transcriptional regulator [Enterobacter hormaechei]